MRTVVQFFCDYKKEIEMNNNALDGSFYKKLGEAEVKNSYTFSSKIG